MLRRIQFLLICMLLSITSVAKSEPNYDYQFDALDSVISSAVYDAVESAGRVVSSDAPEEAAQCADDAALVPVEVVLVLDASGSMDRRNPVNHKALLSYAQDAAIAFSKTLYAVNPNSRVAVVSYADGAQIVSGFTEENEQNQLYAAIRGITLGNMTNTGGGMTQAVSLLDSECTPDCQRMVLLLSDGLANEGAEDPIQYAVEQGYAAAERGLVYTIGLVGGMDESSRRITRQTLAAGYETRYFEVDFDEVADITANLASIFMTIAMSGSMRNTDATFYRLWVDGSMDLYIENDEGEYLSSAAWNYKDTASFGVFWILGDDMDEKLVLLHEGNYRISLHGSTTGRGLYALTELHGRAAEERELIRQNVQTHPAMCHTLRLIDGVLTFTDESYNPLDIYAIDPFTGERTRGLEIPAPGRISAEVTVCAYPSKDGTEICKLGKNTSVGVLAHDPDSEYVFIVFPDGNGQACRGWVPATAVSVEGYVPEMIWLDIAAELSVKAVSHRIPHGLSPEADALAAGQKIIVRHAERDISGNEWLYVQPDGELSLVYVPAGCVKNWQIQTTEGFRLGYASAQYAWRVAFGGGYTEVMWVIPQKDDSGVVLSGRTTSGKKPFSQNRGERDAFVVMLDSRGAIEEAVTAGGSDVDSYHCILAAEDGYYVSGITRSNNGDFAGAWDASSTTGKVGKTAGRSNALIARLNEDFSTRWVKSFGSGDASYGFDMVIQLADGNIAGVGWMTASSKGTLRGSGKQDFYVVKLTPDGEVLGTACFGGRENDVPDSAVATPDGGLIMTGCTRGGGTADGLILVLDSDMNIVNQCIYGGSGEDIFDNVRALDDGTYLVTGFTDSPSGNGVGNPKGGTDFWAMNIDSLGRSIWVKRYGGSGDEELCGTTILEDGTSLLLGYTTSDDGNVSGATGNSKDAWAICIDGNGRMLWQYASGLAGDDAFNAAAIDPQDGSYVLAGLCNEKSSSAEALVVKLLPYIQ